MVARVVSTFSLLVCLVCAAFAGPYSDLSAQLRAAKDDKEAERIIRSSPVFEQDSDLQGVMSQQFNGPGGRVAFAKTAINLKSSLEGTPSSRDAKSIVANIKSNPLYNDPGEKASSNWLADSLERLKNFHLPEFKQKNTEFKGPQIFGPWMIYLLWGILGAALIVFLVFAARMIELKGRRKKKTAGLLDEDEPELTLDEWLAAADRLEAEGKYREAVRGLYLACLLKLDEARILKFDRGETNWEHLERFESKASSPEGLDLRGPTKAFDRIWYGFQVNGREDVDRFRGWYRQVADAVQREAA